MRRFCASYLPLTSLLLVLISQSSLAQVTMQQQMPNYSRGPASSAATTRNKAGAPLAQPLPELRSVPEEIAILRLAPGFLLNLNVLDDPDFSGNYRVNERGEITVPVLGTLHVAGETATELGDQIRKQLLSQGILKDPQVTVNLVEYTSAEVNILGEVTSPGKYPLLVPRNLIDILALAGGTTLLAGNEISITSLGKPAEPLSVRYSRGSDPKTVERVVVHPGDTVQVKRAGVVYVLGAVTRPGGYVMQEEGTLSVLQAISLANGTLPTASTKKIYLLHRNLDGTGVIMEVPYRGMTKGKRSDIKLHPTDVVFVPTSTLKSIFINSQNILSAAASASIYATAVH
jgi:polysaccharide export outer membrane protein